MRTLLFSILVAFTFNTFASESRCFILYDINKHKIVSMLGGDFCDQRISADSTFKVALSLMAFDQKLINEHTSFKWDGKKRELAMWNRDQTPMSWLRYSVVWVSQKLTPQLGMKTIQHYLQQFKYGNQDFTGDPGLNNGLTHAWLSSSLKTSPIEQINLLNSLIEQKLPVSTQATKNTLHNLYLKQLSNGFKLYGKTGSGNQPHNTNLRNGWFIGYLIKDKVKFSFVSDFIDTQKSQSKLPGGKIAKDFALHEIASFSPLL